MTKEEKEARIGRLVTEHTELKRSIALWESEVREIGREMERVGGRLWRDPVRTLDDAKKLLTRKDLIDQCERLVNAMIRQDEIKETLRKCNIDV